MGEQGHQNFTIEDLSTTTWWIHKSILPNWGLGGVFLICTGPRCSVAPAGAWFLTAASAFTAKKKPFFPKVVLIVPPGTKQLNYRDQIKKGIEDTFNVSGGKMPAEILSYFAATDWPWVQSDAEYILERLLTVPTGSAISIAGAERLRFNNIERRTGPPVLTHLGQRVSHSSADDLMLPHLHELLRRLLIIANDRQLSVVLFAEHFEFAADKLPEDLRSHPELAVTAVSHNETLRLDFEALMEALKISRTADIESAIQFLGKNIQNESRKAHAMSYIYGDQGLWTNAWDSVKNHVSTLRGTENPAVILNLAQTAAGCGHAENAWELLQLAFEIGLETVEMFNAAAISAKAIGATELLDKIIAEMRVAYPHHPMTMRCAYGRYMSTSRFREAYEIANAVGATFEAAWANLCDQKTPDWDNFIEIGRKSNREQDALASCVIHALNIGQIQPARKFFARIPDRPELGELRNESLFEIVKKEIGFSGTDEEFSQLRTDWESILKYLAMSPNDSELRNRVGESACVILFVCNAGRNDDRIFNQETFGVIGQLLRRGVRAVVCPPAPLRHDLPALWFPVFYQALQDGKCVGLAYAAARDAICQTYPHPCAWGALQLFGDAQLTFTL